MKTEVQKTRGAAGGRISMILLCAALLVGTVAVSAGARSIQQVTARISPNMTIIVDDKERTFYNVSGSEVHPIVYQGTTYLPVRAVGELMGKNVNWDQSALTVTLAGARTDAPVKGTADDSAQQADINAQLRPDFIIVVDSVQKSFTDANGNKVYPLFYDGSTYLPLRAIGELMGKHVAWDGDSKTVTLSGDNLVTDADSFHNGSSTGKPNTNGMITAEDAKAKAMAHAGLSAGKVTFVSQELERDDGRYVYEVEFYTADYKEYDYEIDAYTGEVLSFDYDAEHYKPSSGQDGSSVIGEEKVKSIALKKVSGATNADVVKVKLDHDDGRAIYEVKIIYQSMEYEFEIDAYTGTILEWDSESVYDD